MEQFPIVRIGKTDILRFDISSVYPVRFQKFENRLQDHSFSYQLQSAIFAHKVTALYTMLVQLLS